MKLTRVALMAGLLVVPAMFLTGCSDKTKVRSGVENNINNAKIMIAALKETFSEGRTEAKPDPNARGASGPDARMGLVAVLVAEKIPYAVNKRISDDTKRKAAMDKLAESGKFIDNTLVPKFNEAKKTGKPEDAKALIPLMDQLDQQLDEVSKIID